MEGIMTAQTQVQHTPGPWMTVPRGLNAGYPHTQIMAAGEWIADAVEYNDRGTAEANARLISAAPDLLAALQAAIDAWDATRLRQNNPELQEALEAGRTATAKATGS